MIRTKRNVYQSYYMAPRVVPRTQLQFIRYNSPLTKYSSSYLEPYLKIHAWKCRSFFHLGTMNGLIKARRDKFVVKYGISDNYLCRLLNSRPTC